MSHDSYQACGLLAHYLVGMVVSVRALAPRGRDTLSKDSERSRALLAHHPPREQASSFSLSLRSLVSALHEAEDPVKRWAWSRS